MSVMSVMKKFRTIVVDPPWSYGDESRGCDSEFNAITSKSVTSKYSGTMDIEEIKNFDIIRKLSADPCLIFLWTVGRYVWECPTILERWGFKIELGGKLMVWNKLGSVAKAPGGIRSNAEFIVVGSKGNWKRNKWKTTKGLNACFSATNEGHSIKPALFYRTLRKCTHPPRIDVFARRRHLGFSAWGNQVDQYPKDDLFSKNFPDVKITKLGTGWIHEDI